MYGLGTPIIYSHVQKETCRELFLIIYFFLDSTARKNVHNNLYKKVNYLFYTIVV
jgi:hypothetical protein